MPRQPIKIRFNVSQQTPEQEREYCVALEHFLEAVVRGQIERLRVQGKIGPTDPTSTPPESGQRFTVHDPGQGL